MYFCDCGFVLALQIFPIPYYLFYFLKVLFIYLFIYWLRWVFIAARGLSLVAAGWGYSSLRCTGFLLRWLFFVAEHSL